VSPQKSYHINACILKDKFPVRTKTEVDGGSVMLRKTQQPKEEGPRP
jgi:hypothetical protein